MQMSWFVWQVGRRSEVNSGTFFEVSRRDLMVMVKNGEEGLEYEIRADSRPLE